MPKEKAVLNDARRFLARTDLKDNLSLYKEANGLSNMLSKLPDSQGRKELQERLDDLLAVYFNEAATRLLSLAAGGDEEALDAVVRLAQGEDRAFSDYFLKHYGVKEDSGTQITQAAQNVVRANQKSIPPYWQYVLKRAEEGALWALTALRDGVLKQRADFDTKDEWARVSRILAKRLYLLERQLAK